MLSATRLASPVIASLLASSFMVGCGRDNASSRSFPIRLLPEMFETGPQPAFITAFTDADALDDWYVLDLSEDQPGFMEARAHPGVSIVGDALVLRAHPAALVRFFDAPMGRGIVGTASIAGETDARVPEGVDLHLAPAGALERGETLADVVSTRQDDLLVTLAASMIDRSTYTAAQWQPDNDHPGFHSFETWVADSKTRHIRTLAVSTQNAPIRVALARVDFAPTFRSASSTVGVAKDTELPTVMAHVGMERRPALVVEGGQTISMQVDVPADARAITFGMSRQPSADEGATAWLLTATQDGETQILGSGVLDQHDEVAHFVDQTVDWPENLDAGPVEISWQNLGDRPIVVGQPVLRGPVSPARPNLLLISVDTLRSDHLGYHGYDRPTSPFLDRFAATACAFLDHRSVAPYTLPTHATMFTGMLPPRHGTYSLSSRLNARDLVYLPLLLSRSGYSTAAFTGGGYVSPEFGFAAGFDRYSTSDPLYISDGVGLTWAEPWFLRPIDAATEWICDRRDEPWFAFIHTYVTHNYNAPPEDFAAFDTHPPSAWRETIDQSFTTAAFAPWRKNPPSEGDIQHLIDLYDATIHYADRELERFLTDLERCGALDDTVVVITSDHGEEFYEHGNLRHSISLYEELLRIPLLIRLPGQSSGRRVTEATTQADLLPTLLEVLGFPSIPGLDGASRSSLLRGLGEAPVESPLLAHVDTTLSRRSSLRVGPWKLIEGDQARSLGAPAPAEIELYDLARDPDERHNLATEEPPQLEQLRERLHQVMSELQRSATGSQDALLSPEMNEVLKQLGYVR